ncbi:MAG: hypothetical protein WAM79_23080 [Candidatus Sulfotelmatobacter sp.]
MRVPDFVLKCVGFVCPVEHRDSGGVPSGEPVGTGFFVSVPCEHPEMQAKGACAVYFVTAKHVLDELKSKEIFFSVNKIGGGKTTIEGIIGKRWWYHPTDGSADVAVAQVWPSYDADLISVSILQFGLPELLASVNVGIGDEVYSTGLFAPVDAEHQNVPILRQGNLAMLPAQQIQTELGYADMYLIEARSLGGISGAPVFVRPTIEFKVPERRTGKAFDVFGAGLGVILLGLMHGHWDVKESEMNKARFIHDRQRGVNMGIAMVVPALKILETINQEALVKMRRNEEKRATSGMVPGMDSVKPTQGDAVFTKEDFEGALRKVTRKAASAKK